MKILIILNIKEIHLKNLFKTWQFNTKKFKKMNFKMLAN